MLIRFFEVFVIPGSYVRKAQASLTIDCPGQDFYCLFLPLSPEEEFHINAGLNVGLKVEEIKEIILLMTIYAGLSAAINWMNMPKTLLSSLDVA